MHHKCYHHSNHCCVGCRITDKMRSEPSSQEIGDLGAVGCWTRTENESLENHQTKLHRSDEEPTNGVTAEDECKKNENNLDLRSRSKRRRPVSSVTPDLELTDSSSVSESPEPFIRTLLSQVFGKKK